MPDFTEKQREKLADKDEAMPDGSYPIRNRADLKRAVQAFGRAKNPEKTKLWIIKRAKALDAMDLIPEKWLDEKGISHMAGKLETFLSANGIQTDDIDALAQYGVKGMKWGKNKSIEELQAEQKALDDALGGIDTGTDLDDLSLETAGSNLDAAFAGKKKGPSAMDRMLGRDSDDKFWESSGRNVENFVSGVLGGNAQAQRNKKLVDISTKGTSKAVEFVKNFFGGKNK